VTPSAPSPTPSKSVVVFAAHALALTLLIGFWPTPRSLYPAGFHALGNALLGRGEVPWARFRAPAAETGEIDTVMQGALAGFDEPVWTSRYSAIRFGYWPTAALAAFVLSTPMGPARHLGTLVAGLGLLQLLTLGRVGVTAAYAYYEVAHGPGAPVRGPLHLLLRTGSESLTASIPSTALVLVVWVLVARPRRTLDLGVLRRLLGLPLPDATRGETRGASRAGNDSS
jgi:hypothetical protein